MNPLRKLILISICFQYVKCFDPKSPNFFTNIDPKCNILLSYSTVSSENFVHFTNPRPIYLNLFPLPWQTTPKLRTVRFQEPMTCFLNIVNIQKKDIQIINSIYGKYDRHDNRLVKQLYCNYAFININFGHECKYRWPHGAQLTKGLRILIYKKDR